MAIANAGAHSAQNYWDAVWDHDVAYDFTGAFSSYLGSAGRDRVADAGQEWNSVPGVDLHFARSGNNSVSEFVPYGDCTHANAVHARSDLPGDAGIETIAVVSTCFNSLSDTMYHFQMTFNRSYVFWVGTTNPSPFDGWDTWGVATHEFGHAAGGWGGPYKHFDAGVNPALCGEDVANSYYHTMCKYARNQAASARTLAEHDIDTVQDAY